jgi:hypothetical protein
MYENLFALSINTPWFVDIANYLAMGKLPQHLPPKEHQRVIRQSAMYPWVQGHLFYTGMDLVIRQYIHKDEVYNVDVFCSIGQILPH